MILAIDGKSTKGITIDDAVQQMKGTPGREVVLKVLHEGADQPVEIELVK